MKHSKLISKLSLIIVFASLLSNVLGQIAFQILAFNHVPIDNDYGLRSQVVIALFGVTIPCVVGLAWLVDFAAYHLYEKRGRPIPQSIFYVIIVLGIGCMTLPFGGWVILLTMRIIDDHFNSFQVLLSLFLIGVILIVRGVTQLAVQKQAQQQKQI